LAGVVNGSRDYRRFSFWLDSVPDELEPRPALEGDLDSDVVIVGGGYTGLWTAYYLKKADPSLRIAVVEKEICGFGASGRNGGWCSALFAGARERTERRYSRDGVIALQTAMFDTVDEVGRVAVAEGIDAQYSKDGSLTLATTPAQLVRLRAAIADDRRWGFGERDYAWLDREEARARINAAGCLGGIYTPHCATVHPARLVRGLAHTVEGLGVSIYEQTAATSIEPHSVPTRAGRIRADIVVRATEAYTPELPRSRRMMVPIYSLMIVTEPLDSAIWDEIGWAERETFADGRHLFIYAQRTADGRIAIGGRGAPYHFGSRVRDSYDREPEVFSQLEEVLHSLFPATKEARITHTWGGPVAIPRDWYSSVGFDKASGLAWAGGYVGDGVSTTNLAGRTIRDLVLGHDTELTRLPWVGHRSRRWEPEPLRWLGANLMLRIAASADRAENRTGRRARRMWAVDKITGH
jgi:glycine/D-amino acid oxidase-like deaminating enzyme